MPDATPTHCWWLAIALTHNFQPYTSNTWLLFYFATTVTQGVVVAEMLSRYPCLAPLLSSWTKIGCPVCVRKYPEGRIKLWLWEPSNRYGVYWPLMFWVFLSGKKKEGCPGYRQQVANHNYQRGKSSWPALVPAELWKQQLWILWIESHWCLGFHFRAYP